MSIGLEFQINEEKKKLYETLSHYLSSHGIRHGRENNSEKKQKLIRISSPSKDWEDVNSDLVKGLVEAIDMSDVPALRF